MMYFDSLPIEALEIVIRYTSESPMQTDWKRLISEDSVHELCRIGGSFSDAFRSITENISICDALDATPDRRDMLNQVTLGRTRWNSDKMKRTVLNLSRSLRWLTISSIYVQRMKEERWLLEFEFKSVSLKNLRLCITNGYEFVLDNPLSKLIRFYGRHLDSIEIICSGLDIRKDKLISLWSAVGSYCGALRSLSLIGFRLDPSTTAAMWRGIGRTLHSLYINLCRDGGADGSIVIQQIQKHCRSLRRVFLFKWERTPIEVGGFFSSYGSQLQEVNVAQMNSEECQMVLRHCPNANLHVSINSFERDISLLHHGGQQVFSLCVEPRGEITYHDLLVNAPDSLREVMTCSRICIMYLRVKREPLMASAFLAHPLDCLRSLSISYYSVGSDDLIEPISNATSVLERLNVQIEGAPFFEISSIKRLIERNRGLADVEWHFSGQIVKDHTSTFMCEFYSDLLHACAEAPALEQLTLSTDQSEDNCSCVREAFQVFRLRNICKIFRGNGWSFFL